MDSPESNKLASYFDRSASSVQAYATKLEFGYARPAFQASKGYFEEFPVLSIFLFAFGLLSLFPILFLLGIIAFSIVGIIFFAVGLVLVISLAIILVLGSILILTLFVNVCIAAFLTSMLVSAYLLIRLLTLVRQHGLDGFNAWATEIRGYIVQTLNGVVLDQENESVGSSESSKSMVVVEEKKDSSPIVSEEEAS
ncbi:hypothetical protein E1B28_006471 [Marasmius oreades]|uniref:Promethin n=1 Tax=Marasmius oreades TaxID=181124 RepID=A0A9P7S7J4_9AGAR|nr:uncharacterized protein E1B28_006471 [Marasmius oreades]KAG7095766.1 hypothetical protein E1B28_006471 [Marasmius oreades]